MNSFWKLLDSIRQKPPEVRSHVAFVSAVCLTVLVGLLWTSTLPAQFSELSNSASEVPSGSAVSELKEHVAEGVSGAIDNNGTADGTLNMQPANFATATKRSNLSPVLRTTSTTTASSTVQP